jgi:hypothetical protein
LKFRGALLLFFIIAVAFVSAEPGEISFYGWSKDGRLALLQGSGTGWVFLILDTVTDEVLVSIGPWQGSRDEFIARYDADIQKRLKENKIVSSPPEVIKGSSFDAGGVTYSVRTIEEKGSEADSSGRVPFAGLSVVMESSRGDGKTVYRHTSSGGAPLTGFSIKGVLLSPYEKRAAVICLEEKSSGGKLYTGYRIIGAHLTVGYETSVKAGSGLIQAVLNGQYYICRMLLDKGADPDTRDKRGFTALLLASRNQKWEIALLLVTRGASPGIQDDKGRTPLHYAAEAGRLELCRVLIDRGASKTVADKGGKTPFDLASAKGHKAAADLVKP